MPSGIYTRTKQHKKILSIAHEGRKSHFYKDGRCLKKYYCIDCGKELKDYHAKRCLSCSAKEIMNRPERKEKISGENCNLYIDGRNSKEYYCIDCGSKIDKRSNRRRSCSAKAKWVNSKFRERMSGEMHPNWSGGKVEKYCIDCGKRISYQSVERCNSCSTKIKWQNPEFRKKNKGNTRHKNTKETKEKMRKSNKQNWQKGVYDGVFMSPTKPEKRIMQTLKDSQIDYIFQFRPENYSMIYDFYIPNMNLLIEFDGVYWHSLEKVKERDREKTQYANKNGYNLLRFNENNLDSFESLILEKIKKEENYART